MTTTLPLIRIVDDDEELRNSHGFLLRLKFSAGRTADAES